MKKRTGKKTQAKNARAKTSTKKKASLPLAVSKCVVCGTEVREIHCRLICPVCGAMSDCSDPA